MPSRGRCPIGNVSMGNRLAPSVPRAAFLLALALPSFLLAGCGQSDGVLPEQDAQGRYVIHLTADNRFDPAKAHVPVGSTVAWIVDGGAHDVNAENGEFTSADTGQKDANGYPMLLQPGQTWTHTFNATGTFTYWCHTHHESGMKGVLTITA